MLVVFDRAGHRLPLQSLRLRRIEWWSPGSRRSPPSNRTIAKDLKVDFEVSGDARLRGSRRLRGRWRWSARSKPTIASLFKVFSFEGADHRIEGGDAWIRANKILIRPSRSSYPREPTIRFRGTSYRFPGGDRRCRGGDGRREGQCIRRGGRSIRRACSRTLGKGRGPSLSPRDLFDVHGNAAARELFSGSISPAASGAPLRSSPRGPWPATPDPPRWRSARGSLR